MAKELGVSTRELESKAIELRFRKNRKNAPWSEKECEILKEKYPVYGPKKLAEELNRTTVSIVKKAEGLKLTYNVENQRADSWSEEDINFLKENLNKISVAEIAKKLGRTELAVITKAPKVGLHRMAPGEWTKERLQLLKLGAETMNVYELSKIFKKSLTSVRNAAQKNGIVIYNAQRKDMWTPEEIKILKEKYPTTGTFTKNYLKNRSSSAIRAKATELSLERNVIWSNKEIEILKEKYYNYSNTYIQKLLNEKGLFEISEKAKELSLVKSSHAISHDLVWSDEEIEILKNEYPTHSFSYLKDLLKGKSARDAFRKAKELGITKEKKPSTLKFNYDWSDEEIEILKNEYPDHDCKEFLSKLNKKNIAEIKRKASALGITKNRKRKYNYDWTDEELEILKNEYPYYACEDFINKLNSKSIAEVRRKASELILVKKNRKTKYSYDWSDEEIEILKNEYPHHTYKTLLNKLNNKNIVETRRKVKELSLVKEKKKPPKRYNYNWSDSELELLKKYYPLLGRGTSEIISNKPIKQIEAKAKELELEKLSFCITNTQIKKIVEENPNSYMNILNLLRKK